MADQRFYYNLNEFQAKPRRWPKVIAIFTVVGGIYGAAIGSAISTTAGASGLVGIAAAVMAVLSGVPAGRFSIFFGVLRRVRFGRLFLGIVTAMGGAIIGGFFGMVAVMPLGAILGAVAGWLLTQAVLRGGLFRKLLGRASGLVLGACIGAIVFAVSQSFWDALLGIAWGVGIGAAVGLLLLLPCVKMLDALAPRRYASDKIIDVKVVDAPNDKD